MKIDLHIHTIKTKQDNDKERDIKSPNDFINQLLESNVGIASITNHNIFDDEQFNEIQKINNNQILIFPGVELDVFLNNNEKERRQINLIVNPKYKSKLINFLLDNNISDKNPIDINEVIKEFGHKENESIFYIDQKNDLKFCQDEVEKWFKYNDNFKSVYVHDTKTLEKFQMMFYWKENCLVGSDNLDWNNYKEKYSINLVEYNILINSFEILYDIFKYEETFNIFKKYKILINIDSLKIINSKNKEVNCIKNFQLVKGGINVIFGPKASGKTELLKSIYRSIDINDDKKILYIIDEKNLITEKSILTDFSNEKFSNFRDILENWNSKLDLLKKYDEKDDNISSLLQFHDSIVNKSTSKYKLLNANLNEQTENLQTSVLKQIIEKLKEVKLAVEKYNSNNYSWDKENNLNIIKNINNKIIEEYLFVIREYWKYKIRKNIIVKLKKIFLIHKPNEKIKVSTLGLYKKYLNRKYLFEIISEINNICNKNELFQQEIKSFDIPVENSNLKKTWIIKNKLNKGWIEGEKGTKLKHTVELRDKIEKILSSKKFENINDSLNYIKNNDFRDEDIFWIDSWIENKENKNNKPSHGDLAFIKLFNVLNNENYDYYFIDEPETYLNNEFISNNILPRFLKLSSINKTIIMTTHNSVFGVNSKPVNYIFRTSTNNDHYETWFGNLAEGFLLNYSDFSKKTNLSYEIFKYFEGNKNHYNYRKKVYNEKE